MLTNDDASYAFCLSLKDRTQLQGNWKSQSVWRRKCKQNKYTLYFTDRTYHPHHAPCAAVDERLRAWQADVPILHVLCHDKFTASVSVPSLEMK